MDLTDAAESFIVDLSFDGIERGQVLQLRKVGECMLIRLLQPKAADIEPVEENSTPSDEESQQYTSNGPIQNVH
jgi:hypothetical protein